MKWFRLWCCLAALSGIAPAGGRSAILEFKGAYFLPTGSKFISIYDHGGALYGPELTVQICDQWRWHAFFSVDYFQKHGRSIGLCSPTKISLVPIALGVKYFAPHCRIPSRWDNADFYMGLGIQAVNARTKDCSPFVVPSLSKWGVGVIGKVGAYVYLPCNFVLDAFIDYGFARTQGGLCQRSGCPTVQLTQAHVGGAVFGVGLGYRF